MRRKLVPAIVAVLSACLVGAVAWWAYTAKTSPGPLHPSHAGVRELQGSSGCRECHGNSAAEMTGACLRCHQEIRDQVRDSAGLHGKIERAIANACERCHREHLGAEVRLVSAEAFRDAGVPDAAKYDHAHVGVYGLEGRHVELACAKCHPKADATELADGELRFLGLTQACTPCHEDVHKGDLGTGCASCHGQVRPFKEAPSFSHPKEFPLSDGHSGRSCNECHTTPSVFTGLKTECVACHQDDFDRTTKPSHIGTGLGTDCASCHSTVVWAREVRFEHPAAFALDGAHRIQECAACHTSKTTQKLSADCVSCHRPAYDKTTAPNHTIAGLDTKCASCHGSDVWDRDVKFDHPAKLPLVGGHATVTCAECHQAGTIQAKVVSFKTDQTCTACHASPHTAELETRAAALLRPDGSRDACAACHLGTDTTFAEATPRMTFEVHAATGFPLTAPHNVTDCAKCHAGYSDPREAGDAASRWRRLYPGRAAVDCVACHEDPHKGQFDSSPVGGSCARCHDATRFKPCAFDMTKHDACRFPLTASHRAVACAACHKIVDGTRMFVPTPSECVACHEDVHRGKFDAAGAKPGDKGAQGCDRCHTTETFDRVAWTAQDHERWTEYALTGGHATATCAACHRRDTPAKGKKAPFGAAPTECAKCHADPHAGQFAVGRITDCARCHQDTTSFKALVFDHQRDSRYVPDAEHAKLACVACHLSYDSPGGPIVRYRPLGTECADCHDDRRGKGGKGR